MKKPSKIDGATGLNWRERRGGWVAYWIADARLVARGYPTKTAYLWPPSEQPHPGVVTERDQAFIKKECERLQSEMMVWKAGGVASAVPASPTDIKRMFDGTVRSLSRCYQMDPDSDFQELRYHVLKNYLTSLRAIEDTIGDRVLANLEARWFKQCFREWQTDADGRKRTGRASSLMSMFRTLIGYGAGLLEDRACQRIWTFLCSPGKGKKSALRFASVKRREVTLTADHVVAVRAMAHKRKRPEVALAEAFKFELALRPKDVLGEWIPQSWPGISDVHDRDMKWLVGIQWREIDKNLILKHRVSKTLKGRHALADREAGELRTWDLKLYPMIMEELQHVLPEQRVGPLIKSARTGLPFGPRTSAYGDTWRVIADAAGVPTNIQSRDARAGAITETERVSSIETGRKVAGHKKIDTTGIYSREVDEVTANVAPLRVRARTQNKDSNVCSNVGQKS